MIGFQPGFIRPLIQGVVGTFVTGLLTFWRWAVLALIFGLAVFLGRPRHAGLLLVLASILLTVALLLTGLGGSGGMTTAALLMGMGSLPALPGWVWWVVVGVLFSAGTFLLLGRQTWLRKPARVLFILLALGSIIGGIFANRFINGKSGPLTVGPLPRGIR